MKTWKGLINNTKANELYNITLEVHNNDGKFTDDQHKRINELATVLNNEGFFDETIEQFIDWKQMNDGLHGAVEAVIGGQGNPVKVV